MLKKNQKHIEKDGINYKKLFFELMLVLAVLFGATLAVLYPILKDHGAFDNRNEDANMRQILDEVESYDYTKGRDLNLESRLDRGYLDTNTKKRFYYGLASAVYYCNIGYYKSSETIFITLYDLLPSEEQRSDLETRDVMCDRKQMKDGRKWGQK